MGAFAGAAGSWWHPPTMVVERRAISEPALAARRDRIGALARIKALLLTQSSFKVSSRCPERKQCLPVLILRSCERRLLLQQVAKQNHLLGVGVRLVTKSFSFCVASGFR